MGTSRTLSGVGNSLSKIYSAIGSSPAEIKATGLRYVADKQPGISCAPDGESFHDVAPDGESFHDVAPDGHVVADKKTLTRIKPLGIPPAYTDVWGRRPENSYLQATGHDAKGRKQYRYHPHWREARDETKYERMMAFGETLPKIRERVERDLGKHGLARERVLATIVRLLETTLIRVGNREYAEENHHYGLTTMQNEHVDVSGTTLHFHFVGKSGKEHTIDVKDRRLAQVVQRLRDLPGQEVFQYTDDGGKRHTIDSSDVNEYLHEITGEHFTAKDYRTWAGTVLASLALQEFEAFDSATQAKRNVTAAIKSVAQRLGNTPAICRKCYVHPGVLDMYLDGTMLHALEQRAEQELVDSLHSLRPEEAAVMALLSRRLAEEAAR